MSQTAEATTAQKADSEGGPELDWDLVMEKGWEYGENVIAAVLILIVAFVVSSWAGKALRRKLDKHEKVTAQVTMISVKLLRASILGLALIAVLARFGIQTASIIAILAGLGLAVGLALQGTLTNVAGGLMTMVLRPFTVGDMIQLGDRYYVIDDIGLLVTTAHFFDGCKVTISNKQIWNTEIINLSQPHGGARRVNATFSISYHEDIDKAMAVLQEVLAADERYLTDPEPLIAVGSLDDSSVSLLCYVWTRPDNWWLAKLELTKLVKQAFDSNDITIPFPQRDVHLDRPAPDTADTTDTAEADA